MKASTLTGAAAAVATIAVVLSGCGSDTKASTSASSSASSTSSSTTIAEYLKQNDIQETGVKMGDPGAPAVRLPVPDGWQPVTPEEAPDYAYGALVYGGAESESDPPNIVAVMSKLSGNVDPQKIIELAPGELHDLPGYAPATVDQAGNLGKYPAFALRGTYTRDGTTRFIAQKTVVISASDGLYVLQLNVDGPKAASGILGAATDEIDSDTTIG